MKAQRWHLLNGLAMTYCGRIVCTNHQQYDPLRPSARAMRAHCTGRRALATCRVCLRVSAKEA